MAAPGRRRQLFWPGDTNDTRATFAGYVRGLILIPMENGAVAGPEGERPMLKMIVATAVVVAITSTSAIAGLALTHAAFARVGSANAASIADESQSFRLVAKAPIAFDW
jgi:hypothetical protein